MEATEGIDPEGQVETHLMVCCPLLSDRIWYPG